MRTLIHTLFFILLLTQICFGQWVQLGLGDKAVKDIAAKNSNIFVITSDSGSVYRTTDSGNNWTEIVDTSAVDMTIAPSGTVIMLKKIPFYSSFPNYLFSSSDNGDTWDTLNVIVPLSPHFTRPMKVSFNAVGFIFCGLYSRDAYGEWTNIGLSTDNGITWIYPGWGTDAFGGYLFDNKGESVISAGYSYSWLEQNLIWDQDHIYLSPDHGLTWSYLGNAPLYVGNCDILTLCLNGNILLGGSDYSSGLFLSTDSCTTWTQVSSLNIQTGLSIESGGTLVGTDSLGVFLFSDNGDSLGSRNVGLINLNIHTLSHDNNGYVYAGTGNGIWRRPLTELVTSIDNEPTQPTDFLLSQNYPNPFNPGTVISYQLPVNSDVLLKVFDVLGNEIATLVDEYKPAGKYEVEFNAEKLASGIYFYKLQAGDYSAVKKMILIK